MPRLATVIARGTISRTTGAPNGAEKPLPSLARRAVNYSVALARHAVQGMRKTDAATQQKRIALCMSCENYRPSDGHCSHKNCGCSVQKKAGWESSYCPIGKF